MAREAGWKDLRDFDSEMRDDIFMGRTVDLQAFAKLVREEEREACALIAWNYEPDEYGPIETAIRARGQA